MNEEPLTIPSSLDDTPNTLANDETTEEFIREPLASAPQPWWRKPTWRIVITAVVLLAAIASIAVGVFASAQPRPQLAKITNGAITLSVSASGALQGTTYDVDFSGAGTIAEIDVKVGQQVSQGDTLAKLDTKSLEDGVNEAQTAVNNAQTQLNDAQTNLNKVQAQTTASVNAAYDQEQSALTACNRINDQSQKQQCQQTAQDQYAAAQAQADSQNAAAQAQVDTAQSQVNSAQATLQTAQDNLANATLTAPHNGTVALINGTVGGHPGDTPDGATSTGVFIELVDLSALQLKVNVAEKIVGSVSPSNPVKFTVDTYPGHTFQGSVSGITPLGQLNGNIVNYPVLIDVDGQTVSGVNLLPGMRCTATIITQQRLNVPLIPISAITYAKQAAPLNGKGVLSHGKLLAALASAQQLLTNLQNQGSDLSQDHPTLAYALDFSKGKYTAIPLVIGLSDGKSYEVLAGLDAGQQIVIGQQPIPW
ncbi:MAG: efflux RND transporter periplasmic adaptor subunit [Ktedonobacterales bacterium]